MAYIKYTREILQEVVSSSISMAEILRKLGLKQAGGTYSHIKKKIVSYEISIDHFDSMKSFQEAGRKRNEFKKVTKDEFIKNHLVENKFLKGDTTLKRLIKFSLKA